MHLKLFTLYLAALLWGNSVLCQQKKVEVIGNEVPQKEMYFIGELHEMRELADLKVALIEYLHERSGINDIVMEYGHSRAWLCNKYLSTGDTAVLSFCAPQFREFIVKLKAFNDRQPSDKKLVLHGIDFERLDFVAVLENILHQHPEAANSLFAAAIRDTSVARYSTGYRPTDTELEAVCSDLLKVFNREKEILKQILGEDLTVVEKILNNPSSHRHFQKRDKAMAANLADLDKSINGRFICILGGRHTAPDRDRSTFRLYFEGNGRMDKAAMITMVCKNCSDQFPIIGPEHIRTNEAILSKAFNVYQNPDHYSLIDQAMFHDLTEKKDPLSSYYIFLQDQMDR